ncbi:MAG: hypothetical protein FD174_1669 [Geobacteraceae bacterium]|nr:MAG: hypothetical protein FD174_1669 [Geobacteraceae bacterium]
MVKIRRPLRYQQQTDSREPALEKEPVAEAGGTQATAMRPVVGWVSPTYSVSRAVTLNPKVLAENRCVAFQGDTPVTDYYRILRSQILQRTEGKTGRTVMVTSALPGEGKTLTAINLALTFAKEFKQTSLLVDCDLKQQRIHEVIGFPSDKGLVDYLIDDCPIFELFVWPGIEKMTVISGGKMINESSELLGSPGMRKLVEDMKTRYPDRYVFFDVPPVLTEADAIAFAPLVDYILGLVLNRKKMPAKNGAK